MNLLKDLHKKGNTVILITHDNDIAKQIEERYLKYDLDKFTDSMREDMLEMYEDAKQSFEAADSTHEKALASFNKDFDKMIESINDSIEELCNIKEEILEEQQNSEFYKIKYEARMIPKSEYNNKLNNLVILENKQKKAQLELNQKYARLLAYSNLKKVVKESSSFSL